MRSARDSGGRAYPRASRRGQTQTAQPELRFTTIVRSPLCGGLPTIALWRPKVSSFFRMTTIALLALLAAPAFAQSLQAELWGEVSLYRDEWGVPHVYAKTPRGLGFGFGYAQAESHIEPMLLAYRGVTGRLAAVRGESAEEIDKYSLRMGHREIAERNFPLMDGVTQQLCEGFALGVNAWLAEHLDTAPEWAEGIEPEDVLALWHAFLTSHAPLDLPNVFRRRPAMQSGNAWAVAPSQTPEGKTVLVVNPHQYHDGTFQWTEAHLVLDDYNMSGAALKGLPVIVMGHNPVLGWGLTPNAADTADVFERRLSGPRRNPADPTLADPMEEQALLLEYYSNARPYYVMTDTGLEERFVPVHLRDSGPTLEADGQIYHWRIGGYQALGGLRQLLEMGRARSLEAFQDALFMRQLPCFHLIYGDAYGNVFYSYQAIAGARIFPEAAGSTLDSLTDAQLAWKAPLPAAFEYWGWRTEYDVDELPYVVNPSAGFVHACGVPPWYVTEDAPIYADDWAYGLFGEEESGRGYRIRTLLRTGLRSFRDNQSLLFDVVAPGAQVATAALLEIAEANGGWVDAAHPDLPPLLDVLGEWDALAETRSEGMTAFHMWWSLLRLRLPEFGTDGALRGALESGDPGIQQAALETAEEAARMMRNEFDDLSVPWGDVHRLQRGDQSWPMPGAVSGSPMLVSGDGTFQNGLWPADYGYGYALAVQFGEVLNAVSLVPFGSSDNPESEHYDDQVELLTGRRMKRTRFTEDDVWRNASLAMGRNVILYPRGTEAAFRFESEAPLTAELETRVEPPGFLPESETAFSLFVRPVAQKPEGALSRVAFSFYVPEELCQQEALGRLEVRRYEEGAGWSRVADQAWDYGARTVSGSGPIAGAYAVLGPEDALSGLDTEGEGETEPRRFAPAEIEIPAVVVPPPPKEPAEEEEPLFKFEFKNEPQSLGQSGNVIAPGGGTGERKFKFEIHRDPEKSVGSVPGDAEAQETQPEKKSGGTVKYGLPPHIEELREKARKQREQRQQEEQQQ